MKVLSDGAEKRIVVEIEYLKEGEATPVARQVEPYTIERELPVWRVHTWDRTVDGARTFRLDRMRPPVSPVSASRRATASTPRTSGTRGWRGSFTPRGRTLEARAGRPALTDGSASPTCRSRPRTGSCPRSSPTEARPPSSSRTPHETVAKRARRRSATEPRAQQTLMIA